MGPIGCAERRYGSSTVSCVTAQKSADLNISQFSCVKRKVQFGSADAAFMLTVRLYITRGILSLQNWLSGMQLLTRTLVSV